MNIIDTVSYIKKLEERIKLLNFMYAKAGFDVLVCSHIIKSDVDFSIFTKNNRDCSRKDIVRKGLKFQVHSDVSNKLRYRVIKDVLSINIEL